VYHARYEPDKVVVNHWGSRFELTATIENGVLTLASQGKTSTYKKLDKTPPELDLKPFPLPKQPKKLKPDEVKALQTEIETRHQKDQAVQADDVKPEELSKVYDDNTDFLKKTLAKIGWIDAERFGRKTSGDASWMVLHSEDVSLMMAVLPRV